MKRKRIMLMAILVLTMILSVACSDKNGQVGDAEKPVENQEETGAVENKGDKKDTIKIVTAEVPYFLDPAQKMSGTYLRSVGAVETLTTISAEGNVEMGLAESVEEIDPNSWSIKLRDGVEFWSGKSLDSDALIDSIERYREVSPDGENILQGISFEKIGDLEVQANTEKAHLNLPLILSDVFVMNADLDYSSVEETDLTGMYRVTEYIPRERIELEKFEGYWGKKPEIQYIVWEEMPDPDARKIAAQTGEADIIRDLNPTQVADLEASGQVDVYNITPSGTLSVYMNLQRPPYDDKNVRQAMNWALDREALSLFATEGFSEPSTTWLGSNPQFQDERHIIYKQDLAKAEELMKESGWVKNSKGILEKDGQEMNFILFTFGNDKLLGEAIQNQWMDLGINVDLRHVDYSLIESARDKGEWDGLIETWTNFGDPYPIAYTHFGKDGSANYGKYQSPVVEEALEELEVTADPERQHELLSIINHQVAEDSNLISLMPRPVVDAVNKNLKGYIPHFMSFQYSVNADMTFDN